MQWKSISGRFLRGPMMEFEAGPVTVNGVPWPRCPDGGALKAYQCSADKWTIAFGVRWHPDGREVVEGDVITPAQVWEYTDAALVRVEADIKSVVTVDMAPHQYAGVVFWVYNLGITALKKTVDGESQLLPKINAGRWLDVGAAMGAFVYVRTSKDGKPWKKAEFGLFRRRCAEGCIINGYDFTYACQESRLALPTRTDWQAGPARFYDVVIEGKTPFANVLRDAKAYPLIAQAPPAVVPAPAAPKVTPAPAGLPKIAPKPMPPIADIPKKPASKFSVPITDAPYRIDPNLGLKPLEESQRWQASLAQNGGMLMMRLARYGFMGAGPATVATYIEKDPIFSGAFIALIGVAVMFSVGYVRKCYGDWQRHHAERIASQGLY